MYKYKATRDILCKLGTEVVQAVLKGYLAFHVHCKHVEDISPCINSVSAAFFLYSRHCRCIESSEETDVGEDFPRLSLPFSDLVRAITLSSPGLTQGNLLSSRKENCQT